MRYSLCLLAIFGGVINIPELFNGDKMMMHYLSGIVPLQDHHLEPATEWMLMAFASIAIILTIVAARIKYLERKSVPESDAQLKGMGKVLNSKYYVDEMYNAIIVKPLFTLSNFLYKVFDLKVVDAFVNNMGTASNYLSQQIKIIQTGNISFYLFIMALGMGGILLLILLT